MTTALVLALAMALDGLLGEPKWLWDRLPHPAVLMGRVVGYFDKTFNEGANRRRKGVLSIAAMVIGAGILGEVLSQFGWVVEVIVAAILLAQKSLVQHVTAVADALRVSLHDGRIAVAQIVGRDTTSMNDTSVVRAAIESAAENFSDGVTAPAFWFLVGGLPGLLIYKVTNTADSMIGYRNARYVDFGWAAARFDDLLNLIPARLTAFLIALLHGKLGLWREIVSNARQHRSPNAGWPEAAVALVHNIALAGPRSYDGEMRDFPFVNPDGRHDLDASEIDRTVTILWKTWALCLGLCAGIAIIFA
jgi:adenosylcobinamide-phosphate synthase